ncbi:MAG: hypothetical protein AAFR12_05305 [Cyanobacteria bacterium J06626_6]
MPVTTPGGVAAVLESHHQFAGGSLSDLPVAPRPPLPNSAAATPSPGYTAAARTAATTAPPAAVAAPIATGARAGAVLPSYYTNPANGAISAIAGAVNIPSNFRRGYDRGMQTNTALPQPLRRVDAAIDGVAESVENLVFLAPLTGAVADWMVDTAVGLLPRRSPAPLLDGPRESYLAPGKIQVEGGQCHALYRWRLNLKAPTGHSAGEYKRIYGPILSVSGVTVNLFGVSAFGGIIECYGTEDANTSRERQYFSYLDDFAPPASGKGRKSSPVSVWFSALTSEHGGTYRRQTELLSVSKDPNYVPDDNCGSRSGPPILAPPGTYTTAPPSLPELEPPPQPAIDPAPQPTVAPSPQPADPNAEKRPKFSGGVPLPALGVGILAAGGLAVKNRGQPAVAPAPAIPPPNNPKPTKQDSRCPCNAGLAQRLDKSSSGNAASAAAVLTRLQQMQSFAETAWEATRLNKLINLLTLISVIHNAGMLSRDLGQTIGDLTSNMLATVGIEDEKGSPLDINQLVGTSVENFVKSVVGEEIYENTSKAWLKANRIVSAASQIAYTVRSINDTSKDVIEWTAENTGKIGNALKRWGVVGERAYPWMAERVRAQDSYRRKFERFTQGLENLEDTASSLSQVTGNVREIGEEFNELQEQRQSFRALVSTTPPADTTTAAPESAPIATEATNNATASQSADVAITDAQKGQS